MFKEEDHPREPKGKETGGQFTMSGGKPVPKYIMDKVDGNNVITVYHGTDKEFDKFDIDKTEKWSKFGLWFSDDKESVSQFGGNIKTAQIVLQNPKVISWDTWNDIRDEHAKDDVWFASWKKQLIDQGHDGLKIKGSTEKFGSRTMKNPNIFAVFSNKQIRQ